MNTTEKNLTLAATLQPRRVMQYFAKISNIPRGSGNECAVADYLVAFACKYGLAYHRDDANNVLIKSPATRGKEGAPALLLQGHTDMVCEKNGDVSHDFTADPICLCLDGDFLTAQGTTLGGDDGIAVAMMLALLESDDLPHPALECLFTAGEEVGMDGAIAFDYRLLAARHMINLDSEDEGQITVGCAGGVRTDLAIPVTRRDPEEKEEYMRVTLRGLCGGHSGEDINRGRTGANALLARLLSTLCRTVPFSLVRIDGGSKDNAIPRECEAVVCLPQVQGATLAMTLMQLADTLGEELSPEDHGCTMTCERTERDGALAPMDAESTRRVLCALHTVPHGVLKMSLDIEGLVEYSRNAGVLRTREDAVELTLTSRSCRESLIDHAQTSLDDFAALCGGTVTHRNRYPGWEFAPVSAVRDAYIAAHTALHGVTPSVAAIHAGLECGYIKLQCPDMDIISVGPDMKDIHSPDEKLSLSSVARVWQTLCRVLRDWA
ncbi:MAG: aminoacyl-histidine dipeptidase [Clostridia bacterium]|nr:aminoacyl-histidine dipeptidase [Clostridia bacterium]